MLKSIKLIAMSSISLLIMATDDWKNIEIKTRNAVLQVLAQHAEFNWQEPYKAPEQKQGCGSAFFINAEGYAITNFHVVDQAKSLQVCIPALGKKLIEAKIIGVAPERDVALIKIDDKALVEIKKTLGEVQFIELGDSDALYPTEPVLALGYPLGQRYIKSTVGVIAGREYIDRKSYMHITAPINPGNSGGPLLNRSGKVVGINSAGVPGAQNVGYIIPINDVKNLLKSLYSKPLIHKPILGIWCNPTTEEHAKTLKNPSPNGVYINNITKNSIADKSGIKQGDMLYEINGFEVDQYGDVTVGWASSGKVSLDEFLMRLSLGDPLKLVVYRKGKKLTFDCKYELTALKPIRFIYPDYEPQAIDYEMFGGLCFMTLRINHFSVLQHSPYVAEFTNSKKHDKEIIVITKVLPGSPFHKVGCFFDGQILAKINGKKIKTLADLRDALKLSAQTGKVEISDSDKVATVLSLDEILKDEARLAKDFMFNVSDTVKYLKQNYKPLNSTKPKSHSGS